MKKHPLTWCGFLILCVLAPLPAPFSVEATVVQASEAPPSLRWTYLRRNLPDTPELAAELAKLLNDPRAQLQLTLKDPTALELQGLKSLPRSIAVVAQRFPGADTEQAWREASHPLDLTFLDSSFPNSDEMERIEKIPLRSIQWVSTRIPTQAEREVLSDFHLRHGSLPHSVTLALGYYPRFVDRPWIEELPATLELRWVVTGWPDYHRMDILNLLPNPSSLRIQDDAQWAREDLPYLANIKRLQRVTWETTSANFEGPGVWSLVPEPSYTWIASGYVPSDEQILDFLRSSRQATPIPGLFSLFSLPSPPSALPRRKLVIDDSDGPSLLDAAWLKKWEIILQDYPQAELEWVRSNL